MSELPLLYPGARERERKNSPITHSCYSPLLLRMGMLRLRCLHKAGEEDERPPGRFSADAGCECGMRMRLRAGDTEDKRGGARAVAASGRQMGDSDASGGDDAGCGGWMDADCNQECRWECAQMPHVGG